MNFPKLIAAYLAGIATAIALAAGAATLTITTSGADDARLVPAFTDKLKPGCPSSCRNANVADVKAWVIDELRAVVRNYEYEQARQAISTSTFDPT